MATFTDGNKVQLQWEVPDQQTDLFYAESVLGGGGGLCVFVCGVCVWCLWVVFVGGVCGWCLWGVFVGGVGG